MSLGYDWSIRLCAIASGSNGNCFVLSKKSGAILIDAGLSFKELKRRLQWIGVPIEKIKGIVITHAQPDHLNPGAVRACLEHEVPLYIDKDKETWRRVRRELGWGSEGALALLRKGMIKRFPLDRKFDVGGFHVKAFPIPHDISCVGFSVYDGILKKLSLAYDFGRPSNGEWWDLVQNLANSEALIIEANYDAGIIHQFDQVSDHVLKAKDTHTSNFTAAELVLDAIDASSNKEKLKKVILAHLSRDHNRKSTAKAVVEDTHHRAGVSVPVSVTHRIDDEEYLEIRL